MGGVQSGAFLRFDVDDWLGRGPPLLHFVWAFVEEDLFNQSGIPFGHPIERTVFDNMLARCTAHFRSQSRVTQQPEPVFRELIFIASWQQKSCLAVQHGLIDRPDARSDDWQSDGHRF